VPSKGISSSRTGRKKKITLEGEGKFTSMGRENLNVEYVILRGYNQKVRKGKNKTHNSGKGGGAWGKETTGRKGEPNKRVKKKNTSLEGGSRTIYRGGTCVLQSSSKGQYRRGNINRNLYRVQAF